MAIFCQAQAHAFTGEYLDDETGMTYLRNRYYDPITGRFTTKDPIGVDGGLNSYAYTNNNPVNYTDPEGLVRVEIRVTTSAAPDFTGGSHAFLLIVDDVNNQEFVARGGPTGTDLLNGEIFGPILAQLGNARTGSERIQSDYNGPVFGSRVILDRPGVSADGVLGALESYVSSVNSEPINYDVLGPNSNSFVASAAHMILSQAGDTDWPQAPDIGRATTDILLPGIAGETLTITNISRTVPGWNDQLPINTSLIPSIDTVTNPGGVLIDKAAELINANLSDITGAVFDPVSNQIVFLGNDTASTDKINLDYFYTAIQAVYGSTSPPLVSLDPPAKKHTEWVDYSDGDGIFENGEQGGFFIAYSPVWDSDQTGIPDANVDIVFKGHGLSQN